jgi:glycine betaine/proline transport system ATP-binding protein
MIIQVGTPEEIIAEPASDYVQEFVRDAYPATVLTAGTIMEDIEPELYNWQGPKVAHTLIHRSKNDYAFVMDKQKRPVGMLTHDSVAKGVKKGDTSIVQYIATDFETCSPDMTVEELFPIATASPYPIGVIDDNGRLVGYIRNHTIIESMIQDEPEGADV